MTAFTDPAPRPLPNPGPPPAPKVAEQAFVAALKRERTKRGWRQEDLARRLAASGLNLHPSAIAKIEIGVRMIRLGEAYVIAQTFGLSVERMVGENEGAPGVDVWSALRERIAAVAS